MEEVEVVEEKVNNEVDGVGVEGVVVSDGVVEEADEVDHGAPEGVSDGGE